jgi:hypothetical protein
MTLSGIETATFRFVAQYLNHCATISGPRLISTNFKYILTLQSQAAHLLVGPKWAKHLGPPSEVEIMNVFDNILVTRTDNFHAEPLLIQNTCGLVDGFTI